MAGAANVQEEVVSQIEVARRACTYEGYLGSWHQTPR